MHAVTFTISDSPRLEDRGHNKSPMYLEKMEADMFLEDLDYGDDLCLLCSSGAHLSKKKIRKQRTHGRVNDQQQNDQNR